MLNKYTVYVYRPDGTTERHEDVDFLKVLDDGTLILLWETVSRSVVVTHKQIGYARSNWTVYSMHNNGSPKS